MARWADRLVFDTLGDLYFGESFGTKERDRELRHIPAISLYVHYSSSKLWDIMGEAPANS